MQIVKEDKLSKIEKVLGSSKELNALRSNYATNLEHFVRRETREYNEFVKIDAAAKNGVATVKELIALRDGLIQKIGFGPSWRPEIIFTQIGTSFGITQAEIVYTEAIPSRLVSSSNMVVEKGSRDIWIRIYPNEGMLLDRGVSGPATLEKLVKNAMDADIGALEKSASLFKITHRERLQYAFEKLQRKKLE